jgi:restriction system protein
MGGLLVAPWWAWLLIGGSLYFVLQGAHAFFDPNSPSASKWSTLIDVGSIGLLVVCTIAGATSFMLGRGEPQASDASASARNSDEARKAQNRMSWGQFELLALEAFRRRGFQVTERGQSAEDGSRNLQLTRGRQRFLAHCKAWKTATVDIGAVRELYSMIIVAKAHGGIVITTGNFTQEARTFAAGRQLQLIDGQTLRELLRDEDLGGNTVMPTIMPTHVVDLPTVTR